MVDTIRRRQYTTGRVQARKRRGVFDRLVILFALVGALILLISQLSMLPLFAIQEVAVEGNEFTATKEIEKSVRKEIGGVYLGLFSRANILIFPRRSIERVIESTHPRIAYANVERTSFRSIRVAVRERVSVGVWCSGTPDAKGDCYFLDEDGRVYGRAATFTTAFIQEFYGPLHGRGESPLGKYFLTRADFIKLHQFIEKLETLDLEIVGFVATEGAHELVTESGARVILDPDDAYDEIFENLSLVLSSNDFETDLGDGRLLHIDYIDLRFGNKVFYKFIEE